ncbi:MAG: alpha/beta hydrolase [Firmicutes bacterium]|nr:alpha/beta hydrolase [Bacillota bacterium]
MKGITNSITGFKGLEVPYRFIKHEKTSNQLAIFLPGEGYTNSRPLFHFTEDVFKNHNTDILEIDYQYKEKAYDDFSMEEICEAVQYDVKKVIESVLSEISYDQYYFVAKSLGTIGLNSIMNKPEFENAKIIWLTPLLVRDEVLEAMVQSQHISLSFMGTNDRNYVVPRYERMIQNPNILSSLIPQINHGMQYEADTLGSIDVLKKVIGDIEYFVKSTMIENK